MKWLFLAVGSVVTVVLVCLYCIGWFVGKLSVAEVSNKLYEMSPREVVSGLTQLGKAKGWIKPPTPIPVPAPAATRDLRWEQDLDYLKASIERLHVIAWEYIPPERFAEEIDQIKKRLPELSDYTIACEISRALAFLGDGHTGCGTSQTAFPFRTFPIKVRAFPEGIFVVAATSDHHELLGCQITHIDSHDLSEVAEKTRPYFSAENRLADINNLESAIRHVDFLYAARVSEAPDRTLFRFVDPQGKAFEQTLVGVPAASEKNWVNQETLPGFLSGPSRDFWFEPMLDSGLLYIKYNRCRDHGGLAVMARDIENVLAAEKIEAVVIDLRRNGGGDSSVIDPLFKLLDERGFDRRGRLFVFTDRNTFSSGFHNLLTLKGMHAIHLGEASSQKLNYGGNIQSFSLPNSKLAVAYPTQNSARLPGVEIRVIEPDHGIELTHQNFLAGQDPVLDYVKQNRAKSW